jgi:hypothetical protein
MTYRGFGGQYCMFCQPMLIVRTSIIWLCKNPTCSELIALCKMGWPHEKELSAAVLPYWPVRWELTFYNDLLLRGRCTIVSLNLMEETLDKIHSDHQGIRRCQSRVSMSVWWLGIKQQVEHLVQNCRYVYQGCTRHQTTNAAYTTTRVSMAASRIRFVWAGQTSMTTRCWLLLQVCGSADADNHYISQHYLNIECHLVERIVKTVKNITITLVWFELRTAANGKISEDGHISSRLLLH